MQERMEQHRDTPMDLADASLVAAAESLGERRLFTLDGDFPPPEGDGDQL